MARRVLIGSGWILFGLVAMGGNRAPAAALFVGPGLMLAGIVVSPTAGRR